MTQIQIYLDYAMIAYIIGISFIGFTALWQMYIVLSESYTLNRFEKKKTMIWAAVAMFFSFSLAIYLLCPNSRKKGILFFILGAIGVISYGLAMYFSKQAHLLAQ